MLKFLILLVFIGVVVSQNLNSTNTNLQIESQSSTVETTTTTTTSTSVTIDTQIRLKKELASNYTRKIGERIRLECEFEILQSSNNETPTILPKDFTIYWVKNYQELLKTKKGRVHILRRNLTTMLILKNLEEFDSGSYMCVAELTEPGSISLNDSSETTLIVVNSQNKINSKYQKSKPDVNDYLLQDLALNNQDDSDETPSLNPTIVENSDDKGFCEPYKGSICADYISGNYSVYSTSANQQDLIEERLKAIVPLFLSKQNNMSKRCSTFVVPSLCLFAFPLCDRQSKQPKQICRSDCQQLQADICKNEYYSIKSLFENKINDDVKQASNFLIDCNQLPPSSDSQNDCLPIVQMTISQIESQVISKMNTQQNQHSTINNVNINTALSTSNSKSLNPITTVTSSVNDPTLVKEKCLTSNGVDYRGTISHTRNGYECQKWNAQSPHQHNFKNIAELKSHNYCRNPDNDVEPWCFTTNPEKRKDYCEIPKCISSSIIEENSAASRDKKLTSLLFVLVPSVSIFLVLILILLAFCYCRRSHSAADTTKALSLNTSNLASSSASNNPNSQAAMFQYQSRLRMSNASLGKRAQLVQMPTSRPGSSKSSVASSSNNNSNQIYLNKNRLNPNIEPNQYYRPNYENPIQYNFNYQQQQQHFLIQHQQQQQQQQIQLQNMQNDLNYSI